MDVHVGHMDAVVLVDDGKALVLGAGAGQFIQLLDDGHELRDHGVQIGAGPLFQRFGQNRVVGVGAGLGDDLDGLVELDALLSQQADQFGDDHAGVGVIDLDGGIVGQVMVIAAAGGALGQNQLGTGGNHQILLVDAQAAAGLVGVIGVQEQRQVLVDGGLIEGDAIVDDSLIDGVQVKKVQRVGAALITGDGQLVQAGIVGFACQLDRIDRVSLFGPGVCGQPGVGQLVLDAVLEGLVEQAEVIAQADTVAGQIQRGEGVEEAGSQAAQTAVAQGRLRLDFLNVGQVLARSGQRGAGVVVETQVNKVVGQQLANQKLGADVVEFAALDRLDVGGALLADDVQQGKVDFLVSAGCQRLVGFGFDHSGHIHESYLLIYLPPLAGAEGLSLALARNFWANRYVS